MSDSADENQATPVGHAVLLGLCAALFALRVAAQLVQYASPTRFLPPFDAWQGSGLAYPVLLASQLPILVAMASGRAPCTTELGPGRAWGVGWSRSGRCISAR